jgi:hypothetical protein
MRYTRTHSVVRSSVSSLLSFALHRAAFFRLVFLSPLWFAAVLVSRLPLFLLANLLSIRTILVFSNILDNRKLVENPSKRDASPCFTNAPVAAPRS